MDDKTINFNVIVNQTGFAEKLSKFDITSKFLSAAFLCYYQEMIKKDLSATQSTTFTKENYDIFKSKYEEFTNLVDDTLTLFEKEITTNNS